MLAGVPRLAVAALFVDSIGPYFKRNDVEPWDESRDARNYRGPLPVIAHPPCQRWTNLAALNFKRYGGEHNRPGNDGGCFASALKSVRIWCGVLEHPAYSKAFERYGIQRPSGMRWDFIGDGPNNRQHWVCEVCQSAYGHRARKRTWIYYVGFQKPTPLDFSDQQGSHQCGWFDRKKPVLGKREAALTPTEFAEALISLAIHSRLEGS